MISHGLITTEQLDYALAERVHSGQRVGSELVRLGMITERQLMETLAEQLRVPVADLRMTTPVPDAVERLPEEVARRLEAVPLRMIENVLELALSDVLSNGLRAELEAAAGCSVVGVLAPPSEIRQALDRAYLVTGNVAAHVATFEALESSRHKTVTAKLELDDHAPVVQVVSPDPHPGGARPRVRHPHRAAGATRCGCGSASTARCTTFTELPGRWARRSSAASRSWPT